MSTVTLTWPSGEPVRSGQIEPDAIVTYEVASGKVIKVEKPDGRIAAEQTTDRIR